MQTDIIQEAVKLRRHLHQHPQVSCQEKETSRYLKEKIRAFAKPDQLLEFEHHGIVAVFKGKSKGKSVLIRGDFDALPIQEINDIEYQSRNKGVSHKCGHDGHAAILFALACHLTEHGLDQGTAYLLFQPAEENGEGAKGMINDPLFKSIKPDYAVALHNLPGYKKHHIVYKEGPFTAAANSIIIKLKGKTSHAAEPEKGLNPALAMAEITQEILQLNHPDLEQSDFKIATPIFTTMGDKSYGVSAGYGELHFTLRAWENKVMDQFEKSCKEIAERIANRHGLSPEISWTEQFSANINDKRVVQAIKNAAESHQLPTEERSRPFKWGEDFGLFTTLYPGAMFGIGAGVKSPALHNPDYDFPDELIETGVKMFYSILNELQ
tara:strand:+ start:1566 stop:2705 length:1140 start_codon:yes stop_codon:yes gene_type:complete